MTPLDARADARSSEPWPAGDLISREEAERLCAELNALPKEMRMPRFLDHVLEECEASLPMRLRRAAELAGIAMSLADEMERGGFLTAEELQERRARACCLEGAAHRLAADFDTAEEAFEEGGLLTAVDSPGRGLVYRSLALLRWDLDRNEEAAALLHQAGRLFDAFSMKEEVAVCSALLGLLRAEEGNFRAAVQLLARARLDLDAERRPWLAAQSALAQALCQAVFGERDKAVAAREDAWSLFTRLANGDAVLSFSWLAGQVTAELGDDASAAVILDTLRRKLLAARRVPEATLVALDLGLLWLGAGRRDKVDALVKKMTAACKKAPDLALSLGATLADLAEKAETAGAAAPALRAGLSRKLICFGPVPFA